MTERDTLKLQFLAREGWHDCATATIAGDASNRRYDRLTKGGESVVLMDAPPEKGEDVRPFVRVATYLRAIGLSAPDVLACDPDNGFLLLEDLGDDVFARLIARNPDLEHRLYVAATDLLVALHAHPAPDDLMRFTPTAMCDATGLTFDWYLLAPQAQCHDAAARMAEKFLPILRDHAASTDVLIQRDYHSENAIWLPQRTGVAHVGLLDFQDALAGHRAYDLMSFLQDARRDVDPALAEQMRTRYIERSGTDAAAFDAAFAVLGVQRNLRILGVFARLARQGGKPQYLSLLPRVWRHIESNLAHPALAPVRDLLFDTLPRPTPEHLSRLRST